MEHVHAILRDHLQVLSHILIVHWVQFNQNPTHPKPDAIFHHLLYGLSYLLPRYLNFYRCEESKKMDLYLLIFWNHYDLGLNDVLQFHRIFTHVLQSL